MFMTPLSLQHRKNVEFIAEEWTEVIFDFFFSNQDE